MQLSNPIHRLVFSDPAFTCQTCTLWQGVITVGRSRGNDLIVLDESVSGRHCELLVHWTEVIVRDRGSRNGTFVSEVRVQGQRGVYSGQRLRFGRVAAVLHLDRPEAPEDTELTACHAFRRETERLAQGSTEVPRTPVVVTPCRIPPPQSRIEVSMGTHLVSASLAISSDVPDLPPRGTARYWRTIVRLLGAVPTAERLQ